MFGTPGALGITNFSSQTYKLVNYEVYLMRFILKCQKNVKKKKEQTKSDKVHCMDDPTFYVLGFPTKVTFAQKGRLCL
jgi:hypothetical protein